MNSKFKDYTNKTGWIEEEADGKREIIKVSVVIIGVLGIIITMIWGC